MTDLEGAVERVSDVARRFDHKGGFPSESSDLRTILDALASITRERDAMREGLKPFAEFAQRIPDTVPNAVNVHAAFQQPWADKAMAYVSDFRCAAALVNGVKEQSGSGEPCPICRKPITAGQSRVTAYYDGEGPVDMHEACCNPDVAAPLQTFWDRMLEVDDRNSPEEYPEMILVTYDDVKRAMQEAVQAALVNGEGGK